MTVVMGADRRAPSPVPALDQPPGPRPLPGASGGDEHDVVLRTIGGYITLTDAAQFFGLNYWRLRKAVTRGELPARKIASGQTAPYFVRVTDVTRYITEGFRRRRGRPPGAKNKVPAAG